MQKIMRPHLGVSADERIAKRKSLLVAQAYQLMQQGQWLNTTITELCENAGLNKRYFYESFSNLEQLAITVFEQVTHQLQKVALNALSNATERQLSQSDLSVYVMDKIIHFLLEDPIRYQLLFTDQLTGISLIQTRLSMKQRILDTLVANAKTYYKAEDEQDPMIHITASMLIGGTIETLALWQSGALDITKDQLINDLAQLWQNMGDVTAETILKRKNKTIKN